MPAGLSLRLSTAIACLLPALVACAQSAPPVGTVQASAQAAGTATATPADGPGSGPDPGETLYPPDHYHGSWRLVAADDPYDQGLLVMQVQSSLGLTEGSGSFVLHQPFCDLVADEPIRGSSECELIDLSGEFDRVEAAPERLVLGFHPTADGLEHRLELHRQGDELAGHYVIGEGEVRRAVVARTPPGLAP